ncbi:hypothetical protein AX17_001833 [Amanita inopinata Kibby_2008]|nr:hypothetical protein AX17_001833 [Amanita inopinata Kibby_2008]
MQSSSSNPNARRGFLNKFFPTDRTQKPPAPSASSLIGLKQDHTDSSSEPTVAEISQLAGDFAKLATTHEPLQSPSGVGYTHMRAVLQGIATVADGASPAPGLGTAFQIGLRIVQKAEMAKSNKQMCFDVAQRAYELLKAVNDMNIQSDTSLQDISNSLTQKLNSVYVAISTLATRNLLGHVLYASEDKNAILKCKEFLNWSLSMFQVKLQLLQYRKADGPRMAQPIRKMTDASFEFSFQIPILPASFCGRIPLVEQAKSIIFGTKGANLAITGAGGMGKTTLALALLHDQDIKAHFDAQLHFVSCETIKSATQLVYGLLLASGHGDALDAIGNETDKHRDPKRVLHESFSTSGNMLVVLDNFETPWNESGNRMHIHNVLKDIAALDNITLIITTRVTALPGGIDWQSFLPDDILPPLDIPSARAMFLKEAKLTVEGQESTDLDVLLREVDCIPLAVSLLSRAQKSKSPTQLLKRWRHEQTVMLREPGLSKGTRLDSVEVSIEVSLVPFKGSDEVKLLALLSFLPAGIHDWESELHQMGMRLQRPEQLAHNLIATSLLQETDGVLYMLSPIQHYIRNK